MKQYRILVIFLLVLLFPVKPSFAIESNNVRTMEEIRNEVRNRIAESEASSEAVQERLQERLELSKGQITGIKGKLEEMRKKNITKFFNNMMEKLEKALSRLEKIADRVEKRLLKMKANGKDTASLEVKLGFVRSEIAKVKTELTTAKDSLNTMLTSGTPKEEFFKVKETVKTIWSEIKDIHQSLVGIITEMKGMSREDKVKPTKSVTIEPTEAPEE